ncbi:MAG: hypothetical protein AUJ33_01570 [Parcubacteria group bacterium CG1_02_40_25]|nr:MAG: hypothetical protein AUJ33_01570 [Parcubacteria group bacterium CG1_02_40_25]
MFLKIFYWLPEHGYKKLHGLAWWLVAWSRKSVPYTDRISANTLTGLRVLAGLTLWWLLVLTDWREYLIQIILINVIAFLTDLFDGAVARATGSSSRLGAWLDNIADKLLVLPNLWIVYCLAPMQFLLLGLGPWFIKTGLLLLFIVIIDFLLILLRGYAAWRHVHVEANYFGKVKVFFQCLGIISAQLIVLDHAFPMFLGLHFLIVSLVFSFGSLLVHIWTNLYRFISLKV